MLSADPAPVYLDIDAWARRDAFAHFRDFDKPYFSVCTRFDVAALQDATRAAGASFSLACHFIALRLANLSEPFRYRLEAGRVRIHPVVHASTTVLRDDGSFAFALFEHEQGFARFAERAVRAKAVACGGGFEPRVDDQALLHFTTLPWVHFSSFSHARNWGREDAVPKFAFGRIDADGPRRWMPLSLEVHHALMDGLQLGEYLQAFEAALRRPQDWLRG